MSLPRRSLEPRPGRCLLSSANCNNKTLASCTSVTGWKKSFQIANRVSVLKDGVMQGTWNTTEVTLERLVASMVGRERLDEHFERTLPESANPKLEVRGMCDAKLKSVSFKAYAGEILGLSGLAGAGRSELALAIFGARPVTEGEVLVNGKRVRITSPEEAMIAGIGYLPENRKEQGMFLEMNIAENMAAACLDRFGGWLVNDKSVFSAATTSCNGFVSPLPDQGSGSAH
jgi:ribose transport system ATP-binding protein